MISKMSDEMRRRIKRKTVYALPNRPSERGYKAEDIKKALYSPILDDADSVFSEINRIVDETNANLHQVDSKIKENSAFVYTYNIPATEWKEARGISPYLYSAEMPFLGGDLDADSEVTLLIDPITASTYGIAIGLIQGESIIFYAMEKPEELVSFDVQIQGIRVEERMDLSVPQLMAPIVSARGTVITITESHLQIREPEAYKVFSDNSFYRMVDREEGSTVINLGALPNGRHVIEICSVASEYNDSPRSNPVEMRCGPSNEIDIGATSSVYVDIAGAEIDVDWGDGVCEHLSAPTTHIYRQVDIYTLKISGKIGVIEYDGEDRPTKYVIVEKSLIKEVRINGDWRDIVSSAFSDCQNLESITFNEAMTAIPGKVCKGTSISYVYVPTSVASIGKGAFQSCVNLQWVRVGTNSDLRTIGEEAFCDCVRLVEVSDSAGPSGSGKAYFAGLSQLYSIGGYAFENTAISELRIPPTVQDIGGNAFSLCADLSSVIFDRNVESLGAYIFKSCFYLTSVSLPEDHILEGEPFLSGGFKKVSVGMFDGCRGITEIRLPSTIEEIGVLGLHIQNLIVRYNGTRRQWAEVRLGSGPGFSWDWDSTLICTDD